MRKFYFIIPTVLACVFLFFFLSERKEILARTTAAQAQQEAERQARAKKAEEERNEARRVAEIQAKQREVDREKKFREEEAQKAEMQAAHDALAETFQEKERMYKQMLKVTDDRSLAQDQLRRARDQAKLQQAQIDYIKNSVKEAAAKKTIYEQALGKLETAERNAAARAAALATAAATKKN